MTRQDNLTQTALSKPSYSEGGRIIIAGPCSAETEAQVMETARQHLFGLFPAQPAFATIPATACRGR